LEKTYAGSVAVEFEHIQNEDERLWLYENYEKHMHETVQDGEKLKAL
jgi:2-oxoglutarate dehydrogenase complex dehydrogenase (E1) component-like enzyme